MRPAASRRRPADQGARCSCRARRSSGRFQRLSDAEAVRTPRVSSSPGRHRRSAATDKRSRTSWGGSRSTAMAHHGADRTAVDVRAVDAGLLNRSVAVAVPAQGDVVRGPGRAVVGVDLVHSPSAAGPGSRRTRALRLTSGSGGRRNVHTVGAQETDEGAGKTSGIEGTTPACGRAARGSRSTGRRNDRILLPGDVVVVRPAEPTGRGRSGAVLFLGQSRSRHVPKRTIGQPRAPADRSRRPSAGAHGSTRAAPAASTRVAARCRRGSPSARGVRAATTQRPPRWRVRKMFLGAGGGEERRPLRCRPGAVRAGRSAA